MQSSHFLFEESNPVRIIKIVILTEAFKIKINVKIWNTYFKFEEGAGGEGGVERPCNFKTNIVC